MKDKMKEKSSVFDEQFFFYHLYEIILHRGAEANLAHSITL